MTNVPHRRFRGGPLFPVRGRQGGRQPIGGAETPEGFQLLPAPRHEVPGPAPAPPAVEAADEPRDGVAQEEEELLSLRQVSQPRVMSMQTDGVGRVLASDRGLPWGLPRTLHGVLEGGAAGLPDMKKVQRLRLARSRRHAPRAWSGSRRSRAAVWVRHDECASGTVYTGVPAPCARRAPPTCLSTPSGPGEERVEEGGGAALRASGPAVRPTSGAVAAERYHPAMDRDPRRAGADKSPTAPGGRETRSARARSLARAPHGAGREIAHSRPYFGAGRDLQSLVTTHLFVIVPEHAGSTFLQRALATCRATWNLPCESAVRGSGRVGIRGSDRWAGPHAGGAQDLDHPAAVARRADRHARLPLAA